jgi:hypothetical protein
MIHIALCRETGGEPGCKDAASSALCEVMLRILGRDNQLRRKYVQRRWQGLGDCATVTSRDRCEERETILAHAPTRHSSARRVDRWPACPPPRQADARADEVA